MGKLITQLPNGEQPVSWDTEYIATRDTAATSDKTRRRLARDYKDDWDAGIATTVTAIEAVEATANAAIPISQKGALNGVATLDATGKVPASQLTIVSTAFKGNWDATANSPTLADNTGTGGDFYFVQNGAVRNLGSGNITWTTGAMIIHNGTIWVENEAVNDVLSVNGQTGVVVIDTANIAEASGYRFQTDDSYDAQQAAESPAAGNPYVTVSALDTAIAAISQPGIVIVGNIYSPHNYDDGVNTSGTGENKLLNTLGYTNGTAATQWPLAATYYGGTIDTTTVSLDDVLWACAFQGARSNIITQIEALPNKAYAFNKGNLRIFHNKSTPNANRDSQQYTIDFKDCLLRNASGASFLIAMFYMQPDSQTDADNNCIDNRWKFRNGKFRAAGSTDTGLKIGATRAARFEGLEFQNFQYGINGSFLLNSHFEHGIPASCTTGIYHPKGIWSGAGYAHSASQPKFYDCRFRVTATTHKGIHLEACDNARMIGCQFEGTNGEYGIYIEVPSSGTVLKNFVIEGTRSEIGNGTTWTNALIGFRGRDAYTVTIDTLFHQAADTNTTLLEATNTQGTTIFNLRNIRGNTGGNTWKLKNVNSGGAGAYIMRNTTLQGAPQTAADVIDTVGFPNIWTADSNVPPLSRIDFIKALV